MKRREKEIHALSGDNTAALALDWDNIVVESFLQSVHMLNIDFHEGGW